LNDITSTAEMKA